MTTTVYPIYKLEYGCSVWNNCLRREDSQVVIILDKNPLLHISDARKVVEKWARDNEGAMEINRMYAEKVTPGTDEEYQEDGIIRETREWIKVVTEYVKK